MANEQDDIKELEEEKIEEVDELKMSRTEEPEYSVNFSKVRDKIVFDGQGNKIRFGDIYKHQKTIIIFVRVRIIVFLDFPRVTCVCERPRERASGRCTCPLLELT